MKYGVSNFIVYDDIFSINTKRAQAIAALMKGRGFKYRCTTRATDFQRDPNLARALAESGCLEVCVGTESGSDDMQVAMQKSMTYTLPLMTIFFGMSFPSGLALYWLLFSIFQMIQQYKSSGWGGLTPLLHKLNLVKS